eukprot:s147_g6.t1
MGFKIEEIVHPDEQRFARQFVCSVCLCILSDPMQTICDHVFCGECISPCLACPTCRTPISPEDRKPLRECNRPLLRMMHDLKVWCPYHKHSKVPYAAPRGANESTSTLVGQSASGESSAAVKRPRLEDGEASGNIFEERCSWEGSFTDLLASHLAECPLHLVPCPQGCGAICRRRDLAAHAPSCPKNFEECPICKAEVRFGSMLAHRKEKAELHVQLLEAKLLERRNRFVATAQEHSSETPGTTVPANMAQSAVGATLGAAALLGGCAFLAPATPHAASAPAQLRGAPQGASSTAGAAAPLAGAALLATAAALARPTESATTRRAAAVKKKGVKVVHGKEIPWNLFTPKAPYPGKVIENDVHPQTLTEDTGDANWETCHVTFDHGGKVPYIEGQSIGIIAPGPDKKGETPARIRLYSIASSAVGDNQNSKTVALCVKRVVELDGKFANREKGEDKPDKAGTGFPDNKVYRGVCSNHICDMSPGDDVMITGPTGAEMLLPEDPEANIIMLATGTGIAPMRSYCRLLFHDDAGASADGGRKFKGLAWLFMGVPYSKSLLYDDEHQEYKKSYPDQFKYDYAVSHQDGRVC